MEGDIVNVGARHTIAMFIYLWMPSEILSNVRVRDEFVEISTSVFAVVLRSGTSTFDS